MEDTHINLTAITIAVATFLWYRKGRLWFFYDALLVKCSKQIKDNSLEIERWEEIALEQCAHLSNETFQSLFRFEVEYLRKAILDSKYEFWIADSEATNDTHIEYTDKEAFCRYRLSELFLPDLKYCGIRLFYRALCWNINKEKEQNKGFVVKQLTPEHKQENRGSKQ